LSKVSLHSWRQIIVENDDISGKKSWEKRGFGQKRRSAGKAAQGNFFVVKSPRKNWEGKKAEGRQPLRLFRRFGTSSSGLVPYK
jgi:hypothetical protein